MHVTSILPLALSALATVSAERCVENTIYCGRNLKENYGYNTNDNLYAALRYKSSNDAPTRAQLNGNFNGALFKCGRAPTTGTSGSNARSPLTWIVTCGNDNCVTADYGRDGHCESRSRCEGS